MSTSLGPELPQKTNNTGVSSNSGVLLDPDVTSLFQKLQFKWLRYIVFELNGDKTEIVVDKSGNSHDWHTFLHGLPTNDCRWAVHDFEFETKEGQKDNKLLFINWLPDDASQRNKTMYSSSKDALRRMLNGVEIDIPAHNLSELTYEAVLERVLNH